MGNNCSFNTTMTRRGALTSGIGSVIGFLAPDLGPARDRTDLYVFPRVQAGTTVIAVTRQLKGGSGLCQVSEVRIHVDSQCWADSRHWSVGVPEVGSRAWEENGCHMFSSQAAVVVEAPRSTISKNGIVGFWAERFTPGGSRQRIGSPFLAEFVGENSALAKSYHSGRPSDDVATLTESVALAIARKARTVGKAHNPDMHGRRLASILLPDILRFDPDLPMGFTFAGQNGRHPEDTSDVVVNATLYGSAEPVRVAKPSMQEAFPYFAQSWRS